MKDGKIPISPATRERIAEKLLCSAIFVARIELTETRVRELVERELRTRRS